MVFRMITRGDQLVTRDDFGWPLSFVSISQTSLSEFLEGLLRLYLKGLQC